MVDSSERDREDVCAGLREIETDLAFRVVQAYQKGRMDEFADALAALKDLTELVSRFCRSEW